MFCPFNCPLVEENKSKVASRETCVPPNSVLDKKNSSAAKQTALHSRTPTELIGDRDNLMVNWKVDGQISTSFDKDSRSRGCSDAFVDRVLVDQDAKSKGLAQANDLFGKFDELLGIWDDKTDLFSDTREQSDIIGRDSPKITTKVEENKTKVASRETCVLPNSVLAKKEFLSSKADSIAFEDTD